MRRVRCVILLRMRSFIIGLVFLTSFWTSRVVAQESGTADGSEVSLYLGSMLPNQIDGITEILPIFGGRYGIKTTNLGMLEFSFSNIHAEGVDFTTLSATLRADLPAIDQFVGIFYGGVDFNYYRPATASDRTTDTGLHIGTGLMMHTTDTLWFRTDLKFMASPGTSLSILFGVVLKTN